MHNVISAFLKTAPKTAAGARIWAFSKTQQERRRGAHATWIKKLLKALNVDEAHAGVDVEHSTGSSWLGSTKVSGIGSTDKDNLYVQEKDGEQHWLHVGGISRELGMAPSEVEQAIRDTQR